MIRHGVEKMFVKDVAARLGARTRLDARLGVWTKPDATL